MSQLNEIRASILPGRDQRAQRVGMTALVILQVGSSHRLPPSMMGNLSRVGGTWRCFEASCCPALEESLGRQPERYGRFVQVFEFVLVEAVVLPACSAGAGSRSVVI